MPIKMGRRAAIGDYKMTKCRRRPSSRQHTALLYIIFFGFHGAIDIVFGYTSLFYLLVSWAWRDWLLSWLTNHRSSVLWHCWLGHLTRKTVSEMTHNVSSGTLNSTIPPIPVLWRCWLGHLTGKIVVPEITCSVLSGMLNSSIPVPYLCSLRYSMLVFMIIPRKFIW